MKYALAGLFALACAQAEPLPTLYCECSVKTAEDWCSGFQIRFGGHQAQIAFSTTEPTWSLPHNVDETKDKLTINAWDEGHLMGTLTIDRLTGKFRSERIEYYSWEMNGWIYDGVCRPLPASGEIRNPDPR